MDMPYNYLYLYLLMDMPYKYKKIFCGYDLYFYIYGLGPDRNDNAGGTEEGAALPSCTHMRCMFTLYSLGQYQWTIEEVQRRVLDLFHAHIGEPIEKSVVPYSQFKCSRQKMRKLKISKLRA